MKPIIEWLQDLPEDIRERAVRQGVQVWVVRSLVEFQELITKIVTK